MEPLGEALLELAFLDLRRIGLAATAAEQVIEAATQAPAASYIYHVISQLDMWMGLLIIYLQVFLGSSEGMKILLICWLKLYLAVLF